MSRCYWECTLQSSKILHKDVCSNSALDTKVVQKTVGEEILYSPRWVSKWTFKLGIQGKYISLVASTVTSSSPSQNKTVYILRWGPCGNICIFSASSTSQMAPHSSEKSIQPSGSEWMFTCGQLYPLTPMCCILQLTHSLPGTDHSMHQPFTEPLLGCAPSIVISAIGSVKQGRQEVFNKKKKSLVNVAMQNRPRNDAVISTCWERLIMQRNKIISSAMDYGRCICS